MVYGQKFFVNSYTSIDSFASKPYNSYFVECLGEPKNRLKYLHVLMIYFDTFCRIMRLIYNRQEAIFGKVELWDFDAKALIFNIFVRATIFCMHNFTDI